MSVWGTTADENGLGFDRRGRTWPSALVEPKSPRMSLTLDAQSALAEGLGEIPIFQQLTASLRSMPSISR